MFNTQNRKMRKKKHRSAEKLSPSHPAFSLSVYLRLVHSGKSGSKPDLHDTQIRSGI